jgi:hypothetical protein
MAETLPILHRKKEKPPAASAGGGLGAARLKKSFPQAPIPAYVMDPIIRMAIQRMEKRDRAMHRTGNKLALATTVCIRLFAVEQSPEPAVKPGRGFYLQIYGFPLNFLSFRRMITMQTSLSA